jgi:hypothetical protein
VETGERARVDRGEHVRRLDVAGRDYSPGR